MSEYEGIQSVQEIACFIDEHPEIAGELLDYFGGSIEDARKAIEENYSGYYKSLSGYAEELTEDTNQIPEHFGVLYRLRAHGPRYGIWGFTIY